jgi:propionyl-CoA carboxylase alpha chain
VLRERRAACISGTLSNHQRAVGGAWVARLYDRTWNAAVDAHDHGFTVAYADGTRREVAIAAADAFGPLVRAAVDGRRRVVKLDPSATGFRVRYRGADLAMQILTPRHAELAALMPVKAPPDTSRLLLCPMPGLVVRIDVGEGDEVHDGQTLCMVEAMKMENVLRAERRGTVARIRARPGDSLGVDDVIMEFE